MKQYFTFNFETSHRYGINTEYRRLTLGTLYGHNRHVIWQKEQEYIYIQFRGGEFNRFQDIKKIPLLCPHLSHGDNDFNKCVHVLCLKTFMYISALWVHWLMRRSFKYVPYIKHM
jgi:hypothetical protein